VGVADERRDGRFAHGHGLFEQLQSGRTAEILRRLVFIDYKAPSFGFAILRGRLYFYFKIQSRKKLMKPQVISRPSMAKSLTMARTRHDGSRVAQKNVLVEPLRSSSP
jgi:hypothetical protein